MKQQSVLDKELLLAAGQSVTTSAAGEVSGNAVTCEVGELVEQVLLGVFDVTSILSTGGTGHKLAIQDSDDNFNTVKSQTEVTLDATETAVTDNVRYTVAHKLQGEKVRAYYTKGSGTGLDIIKAYIAPAK